MQSYCLCLITILLLSNHVSSNPIPFYDEFGRFNRAHLIPVHSFISYSHVIQFSEFPDDYGGNSDSEYGGAMYGANSDSGYSARDDYRDDYSGNYDDQYGDDSQATTPNSEEVRIDDTVFTSQTYNLFFGDVDGTVPFSGTPNLNLRWKRGELVYQIDQGISEG